MPGVLLGNIQFVEREVPDTIKWGAKQMLAVHRVMGGNRVIDAIGPDPEEISWSGLFFGESASIRARLCDELCKSGREVNLFWGTFSFIVVVSDFRAVYKHEWEVRYQIQCVVVSDPPTPKPSIDTFIDGDFTQIFNIANAAPSVPATPGSVTIPSSFVTALNTAKSTITNAVGTNPSLSDLSLAQLQNPINAAEAAFSTISAGSGTPSGVSLDAITGASTLDGINSFVTEATAIAEESDVKIALGYLGRIVSNLTTLGG